eukprot:TRINITY_DN6015_c2_g1_i1.p1 TRINITY_DN6015_c2_g1~~TRINITY_DN6015_c2_g1_i1.p1  ORF type:complete len:442 (+),score=51.36 TRINITY_DN6015_c2_g1_i1:84-1328(+)
MAIRQSRILLNEFAAPLRKSTPSPTQPTKSKTAAMGLSKLRKDIVSKCMKFSGTTWVGVQNVGPMIWNKSSNNSIEIAFKAKSAIHFKTPFVIDEVMALCTMSGNVDLALEVSQMVSAASTSLGVAGAYLVNDEFELAVNYLRQHAPTDSNISNQFQMNIFLQHLFYKAISSNLDRRCFDLVSECSAQLQCNQGGGYQYIVALAQSDSDRELLTSKFKLTDADWKVGHASVNDAFCGNTHAIIQKLQLLPEASVPSKSMLFATAFGSLHERITRNSFHPELSEITAVWKVCMKHSSCLGSTLSTLHVKNIPLIHMYMETLAVFIESPNSDPVEQHEALTELESKFIICFKQASGRENRQFYEFLMRGFVALGDSERYETVLKECKAVGGRRHERSIIRARSLLSSAEEKYLPQK